MVRIAPVTLQYNPKTLWFDPCDLDIHDGDSVIVKTERGTEFGFASDIREVSEEAVAKLNDLKPVLRVATPEDEERALELRQKGKDALPRFKELAAETNEDMHPVMVEYLFDGDKAVFFFEAEDRVDFRDLVRKLAAEFHVRVDMRQIGVRDEARLVGGLGHCGQELCCRRLGGEFCPVSIRMAKEQDLSLNPQKISGVCGRLMCCLRYEYDAYKEFKQRAPKINAKIATPEGTAKVVELDVPRENVKVRLEEGGKTITFPLSAMDEPPEGATRPNSIGDVFDEYANPDPFASSSVAGMFDTAGFTRDDKLATPEARHNTRTRDSKAAPEQEGTRKPRRRRRSKSVLMDAVAPSEKEAAAKGAAETSGEGSKQESPKKQGQRRRGGQRSRKPKAAAPEQPVQQPKQKPKQKQSPKGPKQQGSVRPGQKSSGLRQHSTQKVRSAAHVEDQTAPKQQAAGSYRRARRRSHKTGGQNKNES